MRTKRLIWEPWMKNFSKSLIKWKRKCSRFKIWANIRYLSWSKISRRKRRRTNWWRISKNFSKRWPRLTMSRMIRCRNWSLKRWKSLESRLSSINNWLTKRFPTSTPISKSTRSLSNWIRRFRKKRHWGSLKALNQSWLLSKKRRSNQMARLTSWM